MATLTVYPDASPGATTVDGSVQGAGWSTWSVIRGSAGYASNDSLSSELYVGIETALSSGEYEYLDRCILLFDTSSLGSGANISAAILSLYGYNKVDQMGITPDIDIYTSAPDSNISLVAGDFDSLGTTSQTGSPITYANFSIVGYNNFTFNSTGIGNISKTGISKFGARNANYDANNVEPTWNDTFNYSSISGYYADNGSNQPKLVVTYTSGGISVGWLGA